MELTPDHITRLQTFFNTTNFSTQGAVITDLDGTAVHEHQGKTIIHASVELGLKKMVHLGRPVVINTLRFPLSVIRTFGKEWYTISNAPIPVILLNGSQLGHITFNNGEFEFEQLKSTTLLNKEIDEVLAGVTKLMDGGINELVLFYYPEDWRQGEIIWTPSEGRVEKLAAKYLSASSVVSTDLQTLKETLHSQKICMIFLLIEAEKDKLMAYQHSKRSNFFTHKGIDKSSGTREMLEMLNCDLRNSICAGDTDMDIFLEGAGLSVHVGNPNLPFKGYTDTLKLPGFTEFGQLLFHVADMQQKLSLV